MINDPGKSGRLLFEKTRKKQTEVQQCMRTVGDTEVSDDVRRVKIYDFFYQSTSTRIEK